MFGRNTKILFTVILLMSLLFCTGCTKLTKENYEKLGIGMDYNEVAAILGAANECSDSSLFKSCTWELKNKSIKVTFAMDKVIYRSSEGLE